MCIQDEHSNKLPRRRDNEDPFPWHLGAFDAHCHPTDTMTSIASIPQMKTRTLTIMATRSQDQDLVSQTAKQLGIKGPTCLAQEGCKVVPSFGWHPWFSHQLYDDSVPNPTFTQIHGQDIHAAKKSHYEAVLSPSPDDTFIKSLPTPTPLSTYLTQTRSYLSTLPHALIGEIGLDKAFRLPQAFPETHSREEGLTPGGREGRLLSPYRVKMPHQQDILTAQLRLAGELGRAVSVHGVQAHGVLYDTVSATWKGKERVVRSRRERRMIAEGVEESSDEEDDTEMEKPFPPRICLHSFSGSVEVVKEWLRPTIPATIFFSFSTAVNLSSESKEARFAELLKEVPNDKILVESDLDSAGERMDDALEDMYRKICEVKGWDLENGVKKLGENYEAFIFGGQRRKYPVV